METDKSILLIALDDEVDTRVLYDYFFRPETQNGKVDLHFTTSAGVCLELLEKSKHTCAVVLLDINMPGISGFDVLEDIKDRRPDTKVIMVSAYSISDYVEKSKALGASAYIEKPVDFQKLKDTIFNIVAG